MEYIDYYKVLGIDRSASPEEISKAYRRLARKCHPDVNKDPGAEEQFKRINEAHQVLSDAGKRRRYDTLGNGWRDGQPFQPPAGWGDGTRVEFRTYPDGDIGGGRDWSDFFASIFGDMGGGGRSGRTAERWSGRGRKGRQAGGADGYPAEPLDPGLEDLFGGSFGAARGRARQRRGGDIEGELQVELEDAIHGSTRTVQLQSSEGTVKTYEIKIPPGMHDGARIRLGGRGGQGRAGGPDGDLLLTVRLAPHPDFRVDGEDLVVTVPVAPWEAALGGSVRVTTPDGPVEMKLPPGRSSGDRLRLRGKGMPRGEGPRGDLFAEIRIVIPERLTDGERRLFEELRDGSKFKPRGE